MKVNVGELIEKLKTFPKDLMVLSFKTVIYDESTNWDDEQIYHIQEPWLSEGKQFVFITVDEDRECENFETLDIDPKLIKRGNEFKLKML